MRINFSDITREDLYPSKKIVDPKPQPDNGVQSNSHCVKIECGVDEVKTSLLPGLTGNPLTNKELSKFPPSLQAQTYMVAKLIGANVEPADKKDGLTSSNAFSKGAKGEFATEGEITKFVIMGKEIPKEAYAQAYSNLVKQLPLPKMNVVGLMDGMKDIITRVQPGGGLAPKGDETKPYVYNAYDIAGGGPAAVPTPMPR